MKSSFVVAGIEPAHDVIWLLAGEKVWREFWREVVRLTLIAKDKELTAGLDKDGKPLRPIAPYTRKHRKSAMGPPDPNAPPLTPAHGLSRTRAWFKGRAFPDHAEFFWRGGWGKTLIWHALGAGRLPVRNVIGISPGSLAWIKARAAKWWDARKRQLQAPPERPMAWQPPALAAEVKPPPAPRKIAVRGITDLSRVSGWGAGEQAEVARAIREGYSSGFFEIGPGTGGRGGARLPRLRPTGPGTGRAAAREARKRRKVAR